MVGIGMGVVFLAYCGGIWGFCLVRGYDVTLPQLFKATWPGIQASAPSAGHSLGTINNSTSTTDPSQLLGPVA